MLPKFEYQSFYKFLSSVGLLLLVASAALPWLLLRESSVLLIPADELAELTPRAQTAIEEKQRLHESAVAHLGQISGALMVVGTLVTAFGMWRWWKRQGVQDDRDDADRDKAKHEARSLSAVEIEDRLHREAAEEVDRASPATAELPEKRQSNINSYVAALRDVETLVLDRLRQSSPHNGFTVSWQVQWDSPSGRPIEADGLLRSSGEAADRIIEVKYITRSNSFTMRLRDVVGGWPAVLHSYRASSGRAARMVLLAVIGGEFAPTFQRDRARWVSKANEIAVDGTTGVDVVLITEEQLEQTDGDELMSLLLGDR